MLSVGLSAQQEESSQQTTSTVQAAPEDTDTRPAWAASDPRRYHQLLAWWPQWFGERISCYTWIATTVSGITRCVLRRNPSPGRSVGKGTEIRRGVSQLPRDLECTAVYSGSRGQNHLRDLIMSIYSALKEKGYDPASQLAGFLLTGDPVYITASARPLARQVDREEALELMVKYYLDR